MGIGLYKTVVVAVEHWWYDLKPREVSNEVSL